MAAIIKARSLGLLVSVLALTGVVSLVVDAYTFQETYLTTQEQQQLREERAAALYHGPAATEEQLKAPSEDIVKEHNESMACISDTALKDSKKSTDQQIKELREVGDNKDQFTPTEIPDSSPCSDTMKKELANQAEFGAQTAGLSEGKNGAESQANLPGSVNQIALTNQNKTNQLAGVFAERNQTGAAFNRFCEESPDCETTTAQIERGWLLPVAVAATGVTGSANSRNFNNYLNNERAFADEAMANASRTESRATQQMASYDQYYQLSKLIEVQMAKQQEINAKAEVMKQAALQLEIKMEQGGASHNCSSVAQKSKTWQWWKSRNTCLPA